MENNKLGTGPPDDSVVTSIVDDAFGLCPRPEHFTNYRHCEECAEHDELLRSRDRETLQVCDVGNPGWDPLCFTSVEGFAYYFPALARILLEDPEDDRDWLAPNLLFHLTYAPKGEPNRLIEGFNPAQRRAVRYLLDHLLETRAAQVERWGCAEDLLMAIDLWSE